ncbi:hypothetical protein EDD86DRAFT_238481 [Gorgonomyces haynaldii]|nr:hypothetical protein EDD86DRAFT_238481 [Gorgonomyces haynaldii]
MLLSSLLANTVFAYPSEHKVNLLEKAGPTKLISINSKTFATYTEKPRNYTLAVVFTTTAVEHNCKPCMEFRKELELVMDGWKRQYEPGTFYVAELDYKNGIDVFQANQVTQVPVVMVYHPTEGPLAKSKDKEQYDVVRYGLDAESVARYFSDLTQKQITIQRPVDLAPYIFTGVSALLAVVGLYVFWKPLKTAFYQPTFWMIFSLLFTVVMTGGYMWNSIRGPPFMGAHQGTPQYFAGGFSNQYQVETFIVAGLYALVSLTLVAMVEVTPSIRVSDQQRTTTLVMLAGFVVAYSALLFIFKVKSGHYPFKLLF